MIRGSKLYILYLLMVILIIGSCDQKPAGSSFSDTPRRGVIRISADESFKPVMEAQIRMYEASNPETRIEAAYKSEADCMRDFIRDSSTRLVIVTRGLTDKEYRYMSDSLGYAPGWNIVAADAVAIIVHATSNDTLFTMQRLQEQLSGKVNRDQEIVFDGLNATSTVRFIKDSILKGGNFDTSVVKAAQNSRAVIDYVAEHENAIGLVGISWIGNPEDSSQLALLQKVKIARVRCEFCEGKPFVKPMQASLMSRRYPLVRGLYYIIRENFLGLGTGFTSFLKFERGQLIFRRAYLGPVMDFETRNVRINIGETKKP